MFSCHKSVSFEPQKDMPDLSGKVVLITGANIGLGKQSVLEYARHNPQLIWLAARNLDKAQAALNDIKLAVPNAPIKLLQLDLASTESIKKAASTILTSSSRLDILMLNAGIMAAPPGLTQDGYEFQWGTNYIGHALLTKLLLPLLAATAAQPDADVRIVAVTSYGHHYAPKEGIIWTSLRSTADELGPYVRYGQSKLALILWVRWLATLYPQFTIASVHPGLVQTNLANNATGSNMVVRIALNVAHRILPSVEQGVRNQLWASVARDIESGEYYEPIGVKGAGSVASGDMDLARTLWEYTAKEMEG